MKRLTIKRLTQIVTNLNGSGTIYWPAPTTPPTIDELDSAYYQVHEMQDNPKLTGNENKYGEFIRSSLRIVALQIQNVTEVKKV
jgi:hypothetical protein